MLEVPPDGYVLRLHQCIACRIADGQQTAAHTAAQGDEVPVLSVLDEALHVFRHFGGIAIQNRINGDTADDEGYIVHHRADTTQDERQEVDVVDVLVAPVAHTFHCSNFDEDIHAESYAEEEHNHLYHLVLQAAAVSCGEGLIGENALAVNNLVYYP